jgi:flagellar biosynthetic protein FlhB
MRAALRGRAAMPGEVPELPVPPELDPHNNLKPSTEEAE